jgi:hypothetical protein
MKEMLTSECDQGVSLSMAVQPEGYRLLFNRAATGDAVTVRSSPKRNNDEPEIEYDAVSCLNCSLMLTLMRTCCVLHLCVCRVIDAFSADPFQPLSAVDPLTGLTQQVCSCVTDAVLCRIETCFTRSCVCV